VKLIATGADGGNLVQCSYVMATCSRNSGCSIHIYCFV